MTREGSVRVGLIGEQIQASRSPAMHMQEATALGLPLTYELFDLATLGGAAVLPEILDRTETAGFVGVNITHPCKQSVIVHLHALSDDARDLGAVNTVRFVNGQRIGHNTDWLGFTQALSHSLPDASLAEVTQLGAGGAGSATAYALLQLGAGRLYLFDVQAGRAAELRTRLIRRFGTERIVVVKALPAAIQRSRGVVNATPIGMHAHPGVPLSVTLLRPEHWIAEVVYFPLQTELLRAARALGCRTVDGGDMAVLQAAAAFELFTGLVPDRGRMLARFRRDAVNSA